MELGVEKRPAAVHASLFFHRSRIPQEFNPIVVAVGFYNIVAVTILPVFDTVFTLVSSVDTGAFQVRSENK